MDEAQRSTHTKRGRSSVLCFALRAGHPRTPLRSLLSMALRPPELP